ncbi:hypothetical protein [Azospirillum picis]|uniref:Uncharacterized protein n=1 Tax=Azospirillum picis TaxID=488438 RepID=A0ABU0MJJ4_9PROT|nr:hypothetical protein [Azospirillum picis]MBP2299840.1 hypothetical protein [Azospirillum picis]MDQ0533636.1 hypothetical protein [Azospirillum picis]
MLLDAGRLAETARMIEDDIATAVARGQAERRGAKARPVPIPQAAPLTGTIRT